jgi:homoserine kinase
MPSAQHTLLSVALKPDTHTIKGFGRPIYRTLSSSAAAAAAAAAAVSNLISTKLSIEELTVTIGLGMD